MTLLDTITRAAAAAANSGDLSSSPAFPFILNPNTIFPTLKPDLESLPSLPITRVSGWSISPVDSKIIESTSKFSDDLDSILRKLQSVNRSEFLDLLNAFLQSIGEHLGIRFDPGPSIDRVFDFSRSAIESLGPFLSHGASGLIIEASVHFKAWELIETLIVQGLIGQFYSANLVEKLADHNQARLLCLFVKHVGDLRPSDLVIPLRFFLSPSDYTYNCYLEVKREWELQALSAIEKATTKGLPKKSAILAKKASILLMMAHDGFSPAEHCLHYVFGSCKIDRLVLSSAISTLSGREILSLVRYFGKWLKKYENFPMAGSCLQAKTVLNLTSCDDIPSLNSVVRSLGVILDEQISYLVLNSEFHEEIMDLQRIASDLASEANESGSLCAIVEHLRSQFQKK